MHHRPMRSIHTTSYTKDHNDFLFGKPELQDRRGDPRNTGYVFTVKESKYCDDGRFDPDLEEEARNNPIINSFVQQDLSYYEPRNEQVRKPEYEVDGIPYRRNKDEPRNKYRFGLLEWTLDRESKVWRERYEFNGAPPYERMKKKNFGYIQPKQKLPFDLPPPEVLYHEEFASGFRCSKFEIPDISINNLNWAEFEVFNDFLIKLQKAQRITDIRHGKAVETLEDVTDERIIIEMKNMYENIDTENPDFQPYFNGFKTRRVEHMKEMINEELNYIESLETHGFPLLNDEFDATISVMTQMKKRFSPETIQAFQNLLSNTTISGNPNSAFCIPWKVNHPSTTPTDEENIQENIWVISEDYPYGFTKTVLQEEYQNRFETPLNLEIHPDVIFIPPPHYQMKGMSEIVFPLHVWGIIPEIKYMAWFIWHKIHILLRGRGYIGIGELESLLFNHFNIIFDPRAWGFASFFKFLEFFDDQFAIVGSRAGNLRLLQVQINEPEVEFIVSCDPDIQRLLQNAEKKENSLPILIPGQVSRRVDNVGTGDPMQHVYDMWTDLVREDDRPIYAKHSINKGDVFRCLTVKVFSFQKFYVQLIEQIPQFQKFEIEMRNYFMTRQDKHVKIPKKGSLTEGMYLAVLHKKDDGEVREWYRAQIIYVMSENRAGVQLIDYGHTVFANRDEMRLLPRVFLLEQDVVAIPCQFRLWDKSRKSVLGNDMEMGRLLKQFLSEMRDVELVKFHYRQVEPESGRIAWVITTMLCDAIFDKFTTPNSLCDVIAYKFFDLKEVPSDGPKLISQEDCKDDWSLLERTDVKLPDPPIFRSWIEREQKLGGLELPWFHRQAEDQRERADGEKCLCKAEINRVSDEDVEFEYRMYEVFDREDSGLLEGEEEAEEYPQQLNEYDRAPKQFMKMYCGGRFGGCRTKIASQGFPC